MSDEESFVILGTSPTSSMDTINSLPTASNSPSLKEDTVNVEVAPLNEITKLCSNGLAQSQLTTSTSSEGSQFSIVHNVNAPKMINEASDVNGALIADCMSPTPPRILTSVCSSISENNTMSSKDECSTNPPATGMTTSMSSNSAKPPPSQEPSLAANFILGEVTSDILKASVYSQFPSICSMGACPEDVVKLQNIMSEYMELKKTLHNTNITMKKLYDQAEKWKAETKSREENQKIEIAKLRNENQNLRRDLEMKVEQIIINEEARRKEHEEFIQNLSEKTARIENMSTQIMRLEQQQLASFELIPKNEIEQANQTNQATEAETVAEYVTTMEHQRIVKDFERKMSAIVAQNLELKDMQTLYIDEINCLKVNLVAAEELQKKNEVDIQFLKASDVEKSEMFTKFEAERKSLIDDIDVLTQQLELFSRDFKMEQEAKENLSNEKDQLLSDLRELQKKNHELLEEAQKKYEEYNKQTMAATGAFPKTKPLTISTAPRRSVYTHPEDFNCPLCGQIFKTLCILQTHVNQCLDAN